MKLQYDIQAINELHLNQEEKELEILLDPSVNLSIKNSLPIIEQFERLYYK